MPETFTPDNFHLLCDRVSGSDKDLQKIIRDHGYPPCWMRKPGFETLIHIILEQQVSLAAAKAALNKLKERIGKVTPRKLLTLSDAELRACYFSRQKTVYARRLAEALLAKTINLEIFFEWEDDDIRFALKKLKGIGDWTVDVYLIMGLQRLDIFPTGDLAMMNSLKKIKRLPPHTTREDILLMAEKWRPYRSLAAMLFWHIYIIERKIIL